MTDDELLQIIEMSDRYKLPMLDLSDEKITSLPSGISKWTKLPPEIGKLTHLKELNLAGNCMDMFPDEIMRLENLETLCLNNNNINAIPPEIINLKKLTRLYIRFNRFETIGSAIGSLKNLKVLDLGYNRLSALPDEMGSLTNLTELSVESNNLTTLSFKIGNLANLKSLSLKGNQLVSPPPEIIALGIKPVLDYLRAGLDNNCKNWSAKLFIVGKKETGKKSLLNILNDETDKEHVPDNQNSNIQTLNLPHPSEPDTVMRLNVCDFGEYEIFHATHRFLLTNRSIFLVTWNSYYGFEHAELYNLLDIIQTKTPKAPVLIVATHIDKRKPNIPIDDLKKKYPQIVNFYNVSCRTMQGINNLRNGLIDAAANSPLMGEIWPVCWFNTIGAISSLNDKYITLEKILEIMKTNGVAAGHTNTILQWLHELGVILHFHEDKKTVNTVFTKPDWAAKCIIKALSSDEVVKNSGTISKNDMKTIWAEYDQTVQSQLAYLLEKFDIAFPSPQNSNSCIVVEHLPFESTGYCNKWDDILKKPGCNEIIIKFCFKVAMPLGIPIWFIARFYRYLTNFWQTGALFSDGTVNKHLALIQAYPHDRYFTISVRGSYPWNFFCLLRDGIEFTLNRFPGLMINRLIPCECNRASRCGHEFDYDLLVNRFNNKNGGKNIECPETFKKISVPYLIFGTDWNTHQLVLSRMEKLKAKNTGKRYEDVNEINSLRELAQREFTKHFHYIQTHEETHCPNIFALRFPESQGNVKSIVIEKMDVIEKMELKLYCQSPGCWHPVEKGGNYDIGQPQKWLNEAWSYINKLSTILQYAAPVYGQWVSIDEKQYKKMCWDDTNSMKELVKKLQELKDKQTQSLSFIGNTEADMDNFSLASLRGLLDEKDPTHDWGGLKKVLTPEGHYLWLCDFHAGKYGLTND